MGEPQKRSAAQPRDIVIGAGVGVVLGAMLYRLGSAIGPHFPAGWTELLQGLSILIGVIVGLLGIRIRTAGARARS